MLGGVLLLGGYFCWGDTFAGGYFCWGVLLLGGHSTMAHRLLDTSCHARDVASTRDLLSHYRTQQEENKLEMEVSCRSTKLRRALI